MAGSPSAEDATTRALARRAKRWLLGAIGVGASGGLVAGAAALPLPLWGGVALGVAVMLPLTIIAVALAIVVVHPAYPGATVREAASAITMVLLALLPFGPRPDFGELTEPTEKGEGGN